MDTSDCSLEGSSVSPLWFWNSWRGTPCGLWILWRSRTGVEKKVSDPDFPIWELNNFLHNLNTWCAIQKLKVERSFLCSSMNVWRDWIKSFFIGMISFFTVCSQVSWGEKNGNIKERFVHVHIFLVIVFYCRRSRRIAGWSYVTKFKFSSRPAMACAPQSSTMMYWLHIFINRFTAFIPIFSLCNELAACSTIFSCYKTLTNYNGRNNPLGHLL